MNSLTTFPTNVTVGFGTAALGPNCYQVVTWALQSGFRVFDTAEADWWYDQRSTGKALHDFFITTTTPTAAAQPQLLDDECLDEKGLVCGTSSPGRRSCASENLRVATKIPPWSLTSIDNIRNNAAQSREELLGYCETIWTTTTMMGADHDNNNNKIVPQPQQQPYPLDTYYIHAPTCWEGWHPRCKDHPPLVDLRTAWLGMEAVVADGNARRIGLSNVSPEQLLDIIQFVQDRTSQDHRRGGGGSQAPPPRIPDVVQAYADPVEPAEQLRRVCRDHGIEFVSYSTLGTQHRSTHSSGGHNPVLNSPIVARLAQKHGRSTAEVVLSWALQRGMSVIPRSSQQRHIKELARLLVDQPTFLDATDLSQVDSMKHTL